MLQIWKAIIISSMIIAIHPLNILKSVYAVFNPDSANIPVQSQQEKH